MQKRDAYIEDQTKYIEEKIVEDVLIKKGEIVYYAVIMPTINTFEVIELKVHTVAEDYFTGVEERTKRTYLFYYSQIGKNIFSNRMNALQIVKDAESEAKKNDKVVDCSEKYYEEY